MKKFLLFAVVAILFAACTQDVAVEILSPNIADDAPETLTVGFEGDDTRIQLNENVKTVWTNGDQVSVFYRSDANQKWEYTGETGARIADLTRVDEGVATEDMKRVVVVYPYNENYYINTDTFNVQATLPAVQTYLKDSYGLNGNIMISQGEYNDISLKSVCGWLKLQLTGNGEKVKSITLRGNNGEQVAGELYINSADATAILSSDAGSADDGEIGGVGGDLVFEDTILKEVTLDCDEGVELGAEATAFYIALPPQTFENGLTIEIEDTDALKMTKSTDKAVIIERNTIQPMTSFEVDVKPVLSDYYITTEFDIDTPGKELHYVNDLSKMVNEGNVLVNIDYGDGSFGKTVPHRYDKTGRYTVKFYFDSPITEIVDYAFYNSRVCSVEIPASVTQLGYMSFNSSSLEGITYEKNSSLKIIEGMAFANCRNLESFSIPSSVESIGECVLGGCTNLKDIKNSSSKYICGYLGQDDAIVLHENGSVLKIIAYTAGNTTEDLSCVYLSVDIGWGAFVQCPYIKTVDLVNITNIEQVNFNFCDNLESIRLVETAHIANNVLNYCDKLEAVDAPDAAYIGEDTFCNNKSMAYIKLGSDKLTTISSVGNNNENLKTVHIPSGVESIANSFNGNAMLAEVYCKATTPPTLTDSFDSIPENATLYVPADSVNVYKRAEGWKEFAIVGYDFETGEIVPGQPNNEIWYTATAKVGAYDNTVFGATFVSNEWDAETGKGVITFDGEVTVIGEKAFYGYKTDCNKLISVTIPDSVTTIETSAFSECSSLECITIPEGVKTINSWAFYYCKSLTSVTIPNSVTTIGEYAFEYCKSLTSVTIPNRVTSIADGVFAYCSLLTSVIIPDSVTSIGYQAFGWCSSLTAVSIPNRVTKIGDSAFSGCKSLKYVYCKRTTPPSLGGVTFGNEFSPTVSTSAFDNNASDRKILVPVGSGEAYKSARYWSEYADAIVEYEF